MLSLFLLPNSRFFIIFVVSHGSTVFVHPFIMSSREESPIYVMINFQTENVTMPEIDLRLMGKWLQAVALDHERKIGTMVYRFCSDEDILRYNRDFLQHDYFTDVITFDYSSAKVVSGDIVISLDTVASNAEAFGVSYLSELYRVIVHGLLHLCGIDDKAPGAREIMEANENRALAMLEKMQQSSPSDI